MSAMLSSKWAGPVEISKCHCRFMQQGWSGRSIVRKSQSNSEVICYPLNLRDSSIKSSQSCLLYFHLYRYLFSKYAPFLSAFKEIWSPQWRLPNKGTGRWAIIDLCIHFPVTLIKLGVGTRHFASDRKKESCQGINSAKTRAVQSCKGFLTL